MDVDEPANDSATRRISNVQLVLPGEVVSDDPTSMRGHGTYLLDGKIIASVAGIVEKIGKLLSVRPLRSRYIGETGDVVVGRVVEVASTRWKVDVNARQEAVLQIGAVNLHGGVHRRRTVDDALQMRSYFVENDLIVADVQSTYADGSIALQVPKSYHKLNNGVFVSVPANLIKRVKSHFCSLSCGIDVILGNNGYIWITPSLTEDEQEERAQDETNSWVPKPIAKDTRLNMARVRNAILVLAQLFLPVHPATIMYIYNNSLTLNVSDLLKPEIMEQVSQGIEHVEE